MAWPCWRRRQPGQARKYREHGIKLPTTVETANWYMGFNWLDPVVGKGDTPEQADRNRSCARLSASPSTGKNTWRCSRTARLSVAYGPVPLGYREPPEGVNPVVYDLVDGKPVRKPIDVARRLLAEAGYPDGRNARTGAPLVLYYDSMTGGGSNPQFDWMRRQLAKLGVQLDARHRLQPLPGQDAARFGTDLLLGLERRLSGRRELPVPAVWPQRQGQDRRRERGQLRQPRVRQALRADEAAGRWPRRRNA